jgi:hypothetical protein
MKTLFLLAVFVLSSAARAQLVDTNVALAKPTSGDVAFGFPTSNGNDGNVATFNHADNVSLPPNNPYWTVDLQGTFNLKRVEIVDRLGCCDPNRLNGSEIHILDGNGVQIGATLLVDGLPPSTPDLATGTRIFDNGGNGWAGASSVRIDGHTQYFQFSEFRAIALLPPQAVNVAVNGLITASGPIYTGQAVTAIIDGNPASFAHPLADFGTMGFTYTVNLFDRYTFDRLELLNRGDCCPERLTNVRVTLHNDDGTGAPGPAVWSAAVRADGTNSGFGGLDMLTANLDPAGTFAGQFIRVENLSDQPYNPQIAELRAFSFSSPPPNLANGKPVGCYDASGVPVGTWPGFPASNLVDGVPGTFSHPQPQLSANHYFQVDIGTDTPIGKIKLNGRLDGCCPERLVDSRLEILDGSSNTVFQKVVTGQVTNAVTITTGGVTGRYVRIINANGADYGPQVGELSVFPPDTAPFLFLITSATINPAAGTGSVTFTSETGASYAVLGSSNMTAWTEVAGNIASGGATTTKTFADPGLAGSTRRYYQVKKLP